MELIVPLLTGNNVNNDGWNQQLTDIDNAIQAMAEAQYKNAVFGYQLPVDLDWYEVLCEQKEVLLSLYMGCDCDLGGSQDCYNNDDTVYGGTIVIEEQGVDIRQYIVGATGGPTNGATTFTVPGAAGHNIAVSLSGYGPLWSALTLLSAGDYFYNISTGVITLLSGRLFNTGELYEVIVY